MFSLEIIFPTFQYHKPFCNPFASIVSNAGCPRMETKPTSHKSRHVSGRNVSLWNTLVSSLKSYIFSCSGGQSTSNSRLTYWPLVGEKKKTTKTLVDSYKAHVQKATTWCSSPKCPEPNLSLLIDVQKKLSRQ